MTPQDLLPLTREGMTLIPTQGLPTAAEIDALGARVGVAFPDDYRRFLAGCGSLLVTVHEERWRRPQLGDVAPHWQQTRFELCVFGVCSEVEWLRIDAETAHFRTSEGDFLQDADKSLVPVFAWANTSARICFTPAGTLVEWVRGESSPLDESFEDVLRRLITEQRDYLDELGG